MWTASWLVCLLVGLPSGAAAAAGKVTLTRLNSMSPDPAVRPQPKDVWSTEDVRRQTVFVGHAIDRLTILNNHDIEGNSYRDTGKRDRALPDQVRSPNNPGGFPVVVNGTFFDGGSRLPLGTIIRNGVLDGVGANPTEKRGGIAILQDGTLVLADAEGRSDVSVQARFGQPGNPVLHFMGGGALLRKDGTDVTSAELFTDQVFAQGGEGIDAGQFYATHHVVLAIREGQAYILVNEAAMSGRALQRELKKHFSTAVMFDGGRQLFYDDGGLNTGLPRKDSPTGFGVVPVAGAGGPPGATVRVGPVRPGAVPTPRGAGSP
ncbi:MAG: phosphodiester glycosidase family protein [bacterium]|nr:phosphodiester glycosidase family protein [bacterium]